MSFPVVSLSSYLATIHVTWRGEDYDAHGFVQALKAHPIRGTCHVPVDGVRRRLTNQNLTSAVEWFGVMARDYLISKKIAAPVVFIPIPNSGCTVGSNTRPQTYALAKAIQDAFGGGSSLADCLRWKRNLGSASRQGGTRDARVLYQNLELIGRVPKGSNVILIDDVMTSGGHLRACAAKLKASGVPPILAICGGRTTYSQETAAFKIIEEDLPDFVP